MSESIYSEVIVGGSPGLSGSGGFFLIVDHRKQSGIFVLFKVPVNWDESVSPFYSVSTVFLLNHSLIIIPVIFYK